jgi:LPS-assembly lipoprotein
MSSCDRRSLLLLPLALAACGFTPVYGPGGTGQSLQDNVSVADPVSRNDYYLVRRLEERLGRTDEGAYSLQFATGISIQGLALDPAGNIDRYNVVGATEYNLREKATGRIVTSGVVENFTSYSATGTTIATRASSKDAEERLMVILADQIVTRLLVADLA